MERNEKVSLKIVLESVTQSGLAELLTHAGVQPPRHGRKWDCPACGGRACLSVDESRGLFHCWHPDCGFKGNTATLQKRLGLPVENLSWVGRKKQAIANRDWAALVKVLQEKELGKRVDRILVAKDRQRAGVLDALAYLYRSERLAHTAGPDNPHTWDVLADVYKRRLRLTAELLILDNALGPDLERFLGLSRKSAKGDRDVAIDNVIMLGGFYGRDERFYELCADDSQGCTYSLKISKTPGDEVPNGGPSQGPCSSDNQVARKDLQ